MRGCIVGSDLSVLNLVIVKKGEGELPGLTDEEKPRLRGPKRASKVGGGAGGGGSRQCLKGPQRPSKRTRQCLSTRAKGWWWVGWGWWVRGVY